MKEQCMAWLRTMRRPRMMRRMTALAISITLMGMGVAVFDMLGFGTDPCSTMNLGLSRMIGLPFGTAQLIINVLMLLAVIRFDAGRIGIGTLVNMVFVGYVAEFFMRMIDVFPVLDALTVSARAAIFVPTMALFLMAAALYMAVDTGVAPYDALPQIIARKSGLPFRRVRMCWDTMMMIGGFLLGSTVGLVTLAIAFGLGPMVAFVARKVDPIFN